MQNLARYILILPVLAITAALIGICCFGAWLFLDWLGYSGGKTGVYYIGAVIFGLWLATPAWKIYRSRFPKKAAQADEGEQE